MIYGTQEFATRLKAIMKDGARHDLYEVTCKHAKDMGVHVYGEKPMYLLDRARPREDAEVKTYRIENYEPTTKSGSDKSIDILSKMFNPSLYSITWKEQNDQVDELQNYTLEYYPGYNSLVNWDKDVLLKKMIADPNAVIVVKPEYIPETDTEKINPICVIYGSSCVWDYDRDHFLIFLSKSVVKENSENVEYHDFAYYDKQSYIKIQAYYLESTKSVYMNELERYDYSFDEIPAWFLRGKPNSTDNGQVYFESFFSPALPHWNLAVIHESDLLGAYITHMHPQKYELAEECNHQFGWEGVTLRCVGGKMKSPMESKWNGQDCPNCSGTGYKAVKSPYGTYQFSRKKLEEGSPTGMMPVGYISIPTDATKMLQERTESMIKRGMWAINMDVEDKVGENQSGVAKVIDRSAQHDTIYNIGSVVFNIHLQNQFYFINKYRFGIEASSMGKDDDNNLPEINTPTQFDILSTAELINNYAAASKSGVDKNYLRIKSIEIANRDLSTAPDVRKYLVTMLNIDPLYGFTQDEITNGVSMGVIRKEDWTIHENLKPFIDRAIRENNEFLESPQEEKLALLERYAVELIAKAKPKVDVSGFEV